MKLVSALVLAFGTVVSVTDAAAKLNGKFCAGNI